MIIINKNLFDTYLVNKRTQRNWGNNLGRCTQRQNFSKLSSLAKINQGHKCGRTPNETTKTAEVPCQKFDTYSQYGQQQFWPLSPD